MTTSGGLNTVLAGAAHFVALAVPYKYGGTPTGTTAESLATDCSGMIQFLYAQIGVALPRTSQEQANEGTLVASGPQTQQSMAGLQPGDLIFYNYDGPNSHVALYAGNGQQYAEQHTGTTATLQAVDFSAVSSVRQIVSDPGFDSALTGLGAVGGGVGTTTATAGAPSTYSEAANAAYAYQYFNAQLQSIGVSALNAQAGAAAIVGNLMTESGVNPESHQNGGPGLGIAQWTTGTRVMAGGAQSDLMTGNNAQDLQGQLQAMWQEMNSPTYASAMTVLKAGAGTQGVGALATAWGHLYEGFGVAGDRATNAQNLYLATHGNAPTGSNGGLFTQIADDITNTAVSGVGAVQDTAGAISGIPGDIVSAIEGAINWQRILLGAGGFVLFMIGLVALVESNKTVQGAEMDAAKAAVVA